MPNAPHTPRQTVRVDSDLWARFGALVGQRERSNLIRQFIRWYLREPGVTLPKRP